MLTPNTASSTSDISIPIPQPFSIGEKVKVYFIFNDEYLEGTITDIDNQSYSVYFDGRGIYAYPENRLIKLQ